MSDEQVIAILAAIFLATDGISGTISESAREPWAYRTPDDAILAARELLAAVRHAIPPTVTSPPDGDAAATSGAT